MSKKIRAALHVHSTWSYDGTWSLEKIARKFSRMGYGAVFMFEHDRGFSQEKWEDYQKACAEASTEKILLVPGIEYSDSDNCVHILTTGKELPFLGEGQKSRYTLEKAKEYGGITIMAHPSSRKARERIEEDWQELLFGMELWNRKANGFLLDEAALEFIKKYRLPAFTSLDFHNRKQIFPNWLVLTLPGKSITREACLEAIMERRFAAKALGLPLSFFKEPWVFGIMKVLEGWRKLLLRAIRTKFKFRRNK